jgi:REP element-mobilizing transposase RayT
MARKLRVEYPDAIYHVMNRGDRREPIVRDLADRQRFLQTLGEACAKTGWQVHALCLMSNHFHLVLETPRANLVAGMKWFLGTYTSRFNRRHRLSGHLFSGRYKALIVDGSSRGYLRTVCDYVHLNPVRARLLGPQQELRKFAWSSFSEYLKPPGQRWPWLRVDRLLGELGIPQDSKAGRRQLELRTEERRGQEDGGVAWKSIRRGWALGDAQFKKELLAQMHRNFGAHHAGAEKRESAKEHAEGLVQEALAQMGWTEADLSRRRKGDAGKVRLARQLRRGTTMTLEWIAGRLQMGSASMVTFCLQQRR